MKMKSMSVRTVLLTALGIVVVLIVLMMLLKPEDPAPPDAKEAAVAVSIIEVQPTNTADIVYLPAMVEANLNAILSAEKAGRVVGIEVDRGDKVEKDQLLLQIDDRIWQSNLKQANIAAQDARKNHERFKQLQDAGAVADSEFDRIEKAFIQAESMAEEARINIEQCRVVAPVAGTVNDRFVEIGEYVQPGIPVLQVVDTATVKVVLQIPEKDIYSIHTGDPMTLTVQPLPGRRFEGVVTFVAPQADARNNAFRTDITVGNSDGTLRPGMIAQVEFARGENLDMVSLPMSAVLPSKGDHIVYIAKDGRAIRRKVQIEAITRERALISRGLEDGEQVIVSGNRLLSDGQRVEITGPEADT